jgi:membrane fusion protein (multidrug efflux system)
MSLRYGIVAAGLLLIVGVLGGLKFCQISSLVANAEEMERAGPPPEAVGSAVARTVSWETSLSAVGSLAGAQSVAVSNDAPGIVERIRFESGDLVERGQVLVELDASTERAQRQSGRATRDLAQIALERSRGLLRRGVIAREQLDRDEAAFETAQSELSALEAEIQSKVVRAPFAGRLGIRAVNLGQYLAPGTTTTTLDALGDRFVDFSLPQQALPNLRVGLPVRVEVPGTPDVVQGQLAAIDPTVDDATRSASLRATIPDTGGKLRSGMFVRVSVVLPERADVIIVPRTAVIHASYGDSVFVIEPKSPGSPGMTTTPDGKPVKIARQQFVRLGPSRGDFVVIAAGVQAGQEVVTAGAFKLRSGSPVAVDNTVQPQPQLNPRPENR